MAPRAAGRDQTLGRSDIAITKPANRRARQGGPRIAGPQVAFVAAVLTAFAAWALFAMTFPRDFVLPAISTLFFALASLVALVAWCRGPTAEKDNVTYWDVAGALAFIGICAAALVDPYHMVRLVEGTPRGN